jgi:hypothetical protein
MSGGERWKAQTKANFTIMPNNVYRTNLGLKPEAKLMLLTLMSYIDRNDPGAALKCRGGIRVKNLAVMTGLGERRVRRSIQELEQIGYLTVTPEVGAVSEYRVNTEAIIEVLPVILKL